MHVSPRFAVLASFVLFPSLFASVAVAQPGPRFTVAKEAAEPSPYVVTARANTGVGVFQDIQVPINENFRVRGDGTATGEENADHAGIPMSAGIGFAIRSGNLSYDVVDFDALDMRATSGPAETKSSSYSRLQLTTGVSYSLPLAYGFTGSAGLNTGVRRSSFNNVSSSHYLESLIVGGSIGLKTTGFGVTLTGVFAPKARFGYSDADVLGGHAFAKSTASMSQIAAIIAFPIGPRVYLDTGIEQESVHVTIDDVNEYGDFGLSVQDSRRPTREYDLATSVVRFGLRKEF